MMGLERKKKRLKVHIIGAGLRCQESGEAFRIKQNRTVREYPYLSSKRRNLQ
jgi:hypothetical protein